MSDLLIYKGICIKTRKELKVGDMVRIIDGNDFMDGRKLVDAGIIGKIVNTDFGNPPYVFRIRTRCGVYTLTYWFAMEQVEPVEME